LRLGVVGNLVAAVAGVVSLRVAGEGTRPTFFLLYIPHHPFAVLSIACFVVALMLRRHLLAGLSLVTLLVALFPLMGLRLHGGRAANGRRLRLLTYNVFYAKLDRTALAREIAAASADLVLLQASRSTFSKGELHAQLPDMTLQLNDEFVLATKLPLRAVEFPDRFPDGVAPCWAAYTLEGPIGPFRVVNVHPYSARSGLMDGADPREGIENRRRQIAGATEAAARSTEPVLIVGDTNLPPLSALGRKYFAPYHDAFDDVGFGFGYTFPTKIPWMRIDRALGSPQIRFLSVRVMPRGASDHRALMVDFEIEPPRVR